MSEKRRLSGRERRQSAGKRKASEAATPQPPKKKPSTPILTPAPVSPPPPEHVDQIILPTKIKDGEGLPVLPSAQPPYLSLEEYQSVAERCETHIQIAR